MVPNEPVSEDKNEQDSRRDCVICDEAYQVAFWTDHFGVAEDVLLDVVRRVGPKVENVAAELVIHGGSK